MSHTPSSRERFYATALHAMLNALRGNEASIVLNDHASVTHFKTWREPRARPHEASDTRTRSNNNEPQRQPVRISDINSAHLNELLKHVIKAEQIDTLAFSFVSRGKLVGKFVTHFNEPHQLIDDEVGVGFTVPRHTASAISRNAQKGEALQGASSVREADALTRLNQYSTRLWQIRNLQAGLEEILATCIGLLGADNGMVQLVDRKRHVLVVKAQRGFDKNFLESIRDLPTGHSHACARAWRTNTRVVIEDVEKDAGYVPLLEAARAAGYRSVTSIPLIRRDGAPLAILSLYFAAPCRPSDTELQSLDLYGGQAANFVERCKIEESLRKLLQTCESEIEATAKELEVSNGDLFRQSEQIHELSQTLLRTQDEERRHIARELHDTSGQMLAAIEIVLHQSILEAQSVAPMITSGLLDLQSMVQQLQREIRTTSYLLHPPLLDECGLGPALNWYVEGLSQRSTLAISLEMPEDFGRLPAEMELAIFRLVQECLTNIHRHSESKTAAIRMFRTSQSIQVEVKDQGAGIPPERLAEINSGRTGVGIKGMRERLRQFSGTMSIKSEGLGTDILVTIPIQKVICSTDVKILGAVA